MLSEETQFCEVTQKRSQRPWPVEDIRILFELPFLELLYQAQTTHQQHFEPSTVQLSTLLSIKTGACPEDCAYCPQSAHYSTQGERESLLSVETVLEAAKKAKAFGATRFCMGAAWRSPPRHVLPKLEMMIKEIKHLGLETCMTLGMLTEPQAKTLKDAGLDFYNHNLDTSPEYYQKIITTRCYQDRLDTLDIVRRAGIKVCCGGILGMGETREDRIALLGQLANLPQYPESVPLNQLIPIQGTPLGGTPKLDNFEFVRTVAVARLIMPKSYIRLSAGRSTMSEELQALCFLAGANSIHFGEKLLTTGNVSMDNDKNFFNKLGLKAAL